MQEIIASVIEKSLVGGAFLFLLYHNNVTITGAIRDIATTLGEVSTTMNRMDIRMEQVEKDVEELKRRN